jgi:hypothetical protein
MRRVISDGAGGKLVAQRRAIMAMNRVQFQAGLSMAEFIQQYGT